MDDKNVEGPFKPERVGIKIKSFPELFPAAQAWPVTPPAEHWLKRHHWLLDDEGIPFVAAWHYRCGWHFDLSGPASPEDLDGYRYLAPVTTPVISAMAATEEKILERIARAWDPVGWTWYDETVFDAPARPIFYADQMRRAKAVRDAMLDVVLNDDKLIETYRDIWDGWAQRARLAEAALQQILATTDENRTTTGDGHARAIEIAEQALRHIRIHEYEPGGHHGNEE